MGEIFSILNFALSSTFEIDDARTVWEQTVRDTMLSRLEQQRTEGLKRLEEEKLEAHAKQEQVRQPPDWLGSSAGTINVAVAGNAGSGKSSFINAVRRLRPRDPGAAEVGVSETTVEPCSYEFPGFARARIWDMPGAGTKAFPRDTYIEQAGLRFFDIVIAITCQRFTETEIFICKALMKMHIPLFMVRTKVDTDVSNNLHDLGTPAEETLAYIREELLDAGIERPYLVSSRHWDEYDMPDLIRDGFVTTLRNRGIEVEPRVMRNPAHEPGSEVISGCSTER